MDKQLFRETIKNVKNTLRKKLEQEQFKSYSISVLDVEETKIEDSEGRRLVKGVLSTRDVDSVGDVMEQEFDLERFKNLNGLPVLYNHDGNNIESLLGKVVKMDFTDDKTEITMEFPEKGFSPKIDYILEMVNKGFINGLSIGVRVLDFEFLHDEDGWITGIKILKSEPVEASITPIPANYKAIILPDKPEQSQSEKNSSAELIKILENFNEKIEGGNSNA